MSSIADRLVFLRGSATQAEFADRVGINVNTLRGYETVSYTHLTLPTTPYV